MPTVFRDLERNIGGVHVRNSSRQEYRGSARRVPPGRVAVLREGIPARRFTAVTEWSNADRRGTEMKEVTIHIEVEETVTSVII